MLTGLSLGGAAIGGAIGVGSIVGYVCADTSNFEKGTAKVQLLGEKMVFNLNRSLSRMATSLTQFGRTTMLTGMAVTGLGTAGIVQFGRFDQAMRNSAAVSEVTAAEFTKMSLMAEEASIRLNISAVETAKVFGVLGQAGLEVTEQMLAYNTVLNFAKAGEMNADHASQILVDTMRGLGLSWAETARAADVLTQAQISSSASLSELGEAMAMVSAVAYETHTPLEQVAAALGLMHNVGIKATSAGTALRRGFVNLMDPSSEMRQELRKWNVEVYAANGQMKPFVQIVQEMSWRLKDATEEQRNHAFATIFGVRALTGQLAVFRDGGRMVSDYTSKLQDADGALERIVAKQMIGVWNQLGSVWQRVLSLWRHSVAAAEPQVRAFATQASGLISQLRDWVDTHKELTANITLSTIAIGASLVTLGTFSWVVGKTLGTVRNLSIVFGILGTTASAALGLITTTALPLVAALGAIGLALYVLRAEWNANLNGMKDMLVSWGNALSPIWKSIVSVASKAGNAIAETWADVLDAINVKMASLAIKIAEYLQTKELRKKGYTEEQIKAVLNSPAALKKKLEILQDATGVNSFTSQFKAEVIKGGEAIADHFADIGATVKTQWQKDMAALGVMFNELPGMKTLEGFAEKAEAIMGKLGTAVQAIRAGEPLPGIPTAPGGKGHKPYDPKTTGDALSKAAGPLQRGMQNYIEDIEREWPKMTDYMVTTMTKAMQEIEGAMSNSFQSMADGTKSMGEALRDFVLDIRNAILKMWADVAAQAIMRQVIPFALPGGVNAGGGKPPTNVRYEAPSTPSHVMHEGGIGGRGLNRMRNVPASLFYNAPRLHNGLRANEFPAILEKGEQVIPKNQVGQQPIINTEIKIINQTGRDVRMENKGTTFDIDRMVTTVILKDSTNFGPLKKAGVIN